MKRFRWSGRTQQKINAHVHFPFRLDLTEFCSLPSTLIQGTMTPSSSARLTGISPFLKDGGEGVEVGVVSPCGGVADACVEYRLSSVIVHHGCGFQSGHYTAYCWNSDAGKDNNCTKVRVMSNTCVIQSPGFTVMMPASLGPPAEKSRTRKRTSYSTHA